MSREQYFKSCQEALKEGRVNEETFWCMLDQMDDFCEDDDNDYSKI